MTKENNYGEERRDNHWHLDKRVPLAIIIALVFQTFGAIWWAASMTNRVEVMEAYVANNRYITERLSVIEEGQRWIKSALDEIKVGLHARDKNN